MRSPRTTVLVNLCVAIAMTDVLVVTMEIIDLESKVSVCHLEQTIDTVMKYLNYIKKKSGLGKFFDREFYLPVIFKIPEVWAV